MIGEPAFSKNVPHLCHAGAAFLCMGALRVDFVKTAETIDIPPLKCYNIVNNGTLEKCTMRGEI